MDKEKFLKQWGEECLICGQKVYDPGRHVIKAATTLQIIEGLAMNLPYVGNYYMACQECVDKGELI